jgi:hypothetical protein
VTSEAGARWPNVEAGDSKKCWGWDLFHLKRPLIWHHGHWTHLSGIILAVSCPNKSEIRHCINYIPTKKTWQSRLSESMIFFKWSLKIPWASPRASPVILRASPGNPPGIPCALHNCALEQFRRLYSMHSVQVQSTWTILHIYDYIAQKWRNYVK